MNKSPYEKPYIFCPTCKNELIVKEIDRKKRLMCPSCDFIFWNNPKPCVSVLLEKEGKVLMIQRGVEPLKGYWCLPGGFIDYEETPKEAIVREAKEEVGIDVQNLQLLAVYRIDTDPRGVGLDIIYKGTMSNDIQLSNEHRQVQFFDLSDLPEQIAYKHRETIMEFYK